MKYLEKTKSKKREEYNALKEILDWIADNQKNLSNYPEIFNLVSACLELLDHYSVPDRDSIKTIIEQSQIDRKKLCSLIVQQSESTIASCLSMFNISENELVRSPYYPASPLNQSRTFSFDISEPLERKPSVDKASVRYSTHSLYTAIQFISTLPFQEHSFHFLFYPFHFHSHSHSHGLDFKTQCTCYTVQSG